MAVTPTRRFAPTPRLAGAAIVVAVTCGVVLYLVARARIEPSRAEPVPVAAAAFEPSRRVAIPEVREPARRAAKSDAPREDVLDAYARAEDELRARMDAARAARDHDVIAPVEPLYQQCIEESDAIATALFDEARIERTPWRDLLADPAAEHSHDGLGSIERTAAELVAVGAPAGSKREGVFSFGDRERWRDFVIEVEYAPVRGETRLYFRLGQQVQGAPDEIEAHTLDPEITLEPTEPRTLTATYIGSHRRFEWSANTGLAPDVRDPIAWRRTRTGAFGAVVREGAELRITRLRARILRAGP